MPDRWVPTTCGYCSVGCGMFIGVKNGRAVGVRGNPDHPVNAGVLCPKGLSEHETIHVATRARQPLFRASRKSKFHRVGWNDALGEMASRFRDVQRRHGNDAVGIISTGQLVTEEFYALGKLAQLGLGTRNYDGNTTLCMSTAVSGYKRSFGSDGPPGAYEDLEHADVILLIGANIADNHPILWQRLEANQSKTLIVVDPRVTKTAMLSDVHLPVRPRSDLALINGIIHILIDSDLIDHEYIDRHTSGFDALYESVREYTPAQVSRDHGRSGGTAVPHGLALRQRPRGVHRLDDGRQPQLEGNGDGQRDQQPRAHHRQHRSRRARRRSPLQASAMPWARARPASPRRMPGYRKFEDAADRQELADLWKVPVDRIPSARGLAYPDIIEAVLEQQDPRAVDHRDEPDRVVSESRRAEAGARDAGVPRRSGRLSSDADERIRRPGAAGGDLGREGRHLHQLGAPRQQSQSRGRSAWRSPSRFQHLPRSRVGARMPRRTVSRMDGAEDAFEEWKRVSTGRLCDYSGDDLRSHRSHGRHPVAISRMAPPNPATTRRLYADGRFRPTDGRAQLIPTTWELFPEPPNAEFPFVLNTGRTVEHWHTRTKTGRCRFWSACRRGPGSR